MIFDVSEALAFGEINDIVAKRDDVLQRFGPVFRDPASLKKQDYLEFLSFQHNHHWTGLERLGRRAADDFEGLRAALSILTDEDRRLSSRFDVVLSRIAGVGSATLTPILLCAYPDRYGVWNGTSEAQLRARGLWPTFPRGSTSGQKYQRINDVLVEVASDHHVDLWTLDALWWLERLKTQNPVRHGDAWKKAIWQMASQAEQTANYANGQIVDRTVKNKGLRLSKEVLIEHLGALLREQDYLCAMTGLTLQPDGPDDQLRPSLDRKDSTGHYEADNLQVVARFVNFWKSDTPDDEFRRLLALVRGE